MNRAKSKASKVKGAALLMVLGVMVVLIIMIAGTLGIVASTYNRTVVKYEESQAYYTARSGLDAVWNTLMADSVHDMTCISTGKASTSISASNPSQGRVIQEAIIGKLIKGVDGSVTYDCSQSLMALNGSGSPAVDKTYMEFEIDLSKLNDLSQAEGAFASDSTKTVVRIQLLDLQFDAGGTKVDRNTISTTPDLSNGNSSAKYIDYVRIKVSCTAYDTLTETPVTVSVELTDEVIERSAGAGTVSTGGSSAFDNGTIFGGSVSAGNQTLSNMSKVVGDLFVNGNLDGNTTKEIWLREIDSFVVNGNLGASLPETHLYVYPVEKVGQTKNTPFVFIKQKAKLSNEVYIGYNESRNKVGSQKIDFVCRGLQTSQNSLPHINGNTYIDGPLKMDWGGLNLGNGIFDGDIFISDREAVDSYSGGVFKNGSEVVEKTTMGFFEPIVGSDGKLRPYYISADGSVCFKVKNNGKLFNAITSGNLSQFCTGSIVYYYEEVGNGFAGAWEFEAFRKLLEAAADPDTNIYEYSDYVDAMLDHRGNPINVSSTSDLSRFIRSTSDDVKYLCQLVNDSQFVTGTIISGGTIEIPTGDKAFCYYMSLPYLDGVNIGRPNGLNESATDPRKKPRCVPTLLNKYLDYLQTNTEKIGLSGSSTSGELWVPSEAPGQFLNEERTARCNDLMYFNPVTKTPNTMSWGAALYSAASNGTYTPAQKLDLVSNILNAIYGCDSNGNTDFSIMNFAFKKPAVSVAENPNIVYSNFDSVMNIAETKNGVEVIEINGMNGGIKEIDTTAHDVVVKLKPGYYSNAPTIKVTGKKMAYILLSGTYSFDNMKFVDDFYSTLFAKDYAYEAAKSGETIMKSPRIFIFADENTNINFVNNCRVCAYVYGPKADINFAMSYGNNYNVLYYSSGSYRGSKLSNVGHDMVGSLFMRNITGSNNLTSTFIPFEDGGGEDGGPTINWMQIKYSNTDIQMS